MGNKKYNQKAFVPIKGKCNFDKKLETEVTVLTIKKIIEFFFSSILVISIIIAINVLFFKETDEDAYKNRSNF